MWNLVRLLGLLLALAPAAASGAEDKDDPRKVKIPVEDIRKAKFPGYDAETGELLWELVAAKVSPDPGNPRLLRAVDVRITVYHKGALHVATAKTGSVDTATNEATLVGNVVINFGDEQATHVETETLTWKSKDGTATTEDPVQITRKDMTIEGVGLRLWLSDTRATNGKADRTDHLIILKRVRVVVQPTTKTWLLSQKGPAKDAPKADAKPVVITCTGSLTVYRSEMTAAFRDNVRAAQGDQSVTCDMLTLTLCPSKEDKEKQALDTVTATGHVRIDDAQTIVLADAVIWSREQGSVKIIGRPAEIRWDNGNRIKGGLIQRVGDGSEVLCSATPDHPQSVYLLAYTTAEGFGTPEKKPGALRQPAPPPDKTALRTPNDR